MDPKLSDRSPAVSCLQSKLACAVCHGSELRDVIDIRYSLCWLPIRRLTKFKGRHYAWAYFDIGNEVLAVSEPLVKYSYPSCWFTKDLFRMIVRCNFESSYYFAHKFYQNVVVNYFVIHKTIDSPSRIILALEQSSRWPNLVGRIHNSLQQAAGRRSEGANEFLCCTSSVDRYSNVFITNFKICLIRWCKRFFDSC